MKKIETIHKYILIIQCQIYALELRMILIYMSVINYDSNAQRMHYIQDHIESKSAGPEGIKPDLLKIIGNDIQCNVF